MWYRTFLKGPVRFTGKKWWAPNTKQSGEILNHMALSSLFTQPHFHKINCVFAIFYCLIIDHVMKKRYSYLEIDPLHDFFSFFVSKLKTILSKFSPSENISEALLYSKFIFKVSISWKSTVLRAWHNLWVNWH